MGEGRTSGTDEDGMHGGFREQWKQRWSARLPCIKQFLNGRRYQHLSISTNTCRWHARNPPFLVKRPFPLYNLHPETCITVAFLRRYLRLPITTSPSQHFRLFFCFTQPDQAAMENSSKIPITTPSPDTSANYCVDSEIEAFFTKTSATRRACDTRAKELVGGGEVVPVDVQGACSYTVYAGPELEYVVQFRLESLALKTDITSLATEIYGSLVPKVSFEGKLGDDGGKEALFVYLMTRVRGRTHLDFVLAHGFPENSPDIFAWRKNLMGDIAQ